MAVRLIARRAGSVSPGNSGVASPAISPSPSCASPRDTPALASGGPVALLLLPHPIGYHLADELAARLPQAAQLIEHQRRVSGLGGAQAPLERIEHVLHALGGTFLLLEQVLEAEDLVLQPAVGLLELGAVAKQRQHPVVLIIGLAIRAEAELEKAELTQRLHEGIGGRPPPLMRRFRAPCWMRSDDLAPRSIPATYLTSCCAPNADPVHAPRECAASAAAADCEPRPIAAPRPGARHGRC